MIYGNEIKLLGNWCYLHEFSLFCGGRHVCWFSLWLNQILINLAFSTVIGPNSLQGDLGSHIGGEGDDQRSHWALIGLSVPIKYLNNDGIINEENE